MRPVYDHRIMTTVEITLPDRLASEAARAGLLGDSAIEAMLRERLRASAIERLQAARAALATDPGQAMTPAEIQAEVAGYRAGRAAGS